MVGLIAAAVAAVLAIALAVVFISGSSGSSGGAASPEEAVRGVMSAVAAQDVAKALSYVNPSEIKSVGDVIGLLRHKLAGTGIVSASGPLEPFVHLSIADLRLNVDQAAPDVAFVTATAGTATTVVDGNQLPDKLRPPHPRTTRRTTSLATDGDSLAVVKVGAAWYVSPTTTLLETMRRRMGLPAPDFGATGELGGGATSPEGALTGMADAIARNDVRAAAGFISTKEVPELGAYYRSFAAGFLSGLDRVSVRVTNIDTTVQPMTNGLAKVVVNSADIEASAHGETHTAQYRSGCLSSSGRTKCLPSLFTQISGIRDLFVVVENNGGKWQISPVATVLEYARILFSTVDENVIYRVLRIAQLTPVTQTIPVGSPVTVSLNAGGFAHVTITGPPGKCVEFAADGDLTSFPVGFRLRVPHLGNSYGGSGCANSDYHEVGTLSSSGKLDVVLYDYRLQARQVRTEFQAR